MSKFLEQCYTLNDTQKGIIFECQHFADKPSLYIAQTIISIKSLLDVTIFQKACQIVINHYEQLRAAIHYDPIENQYIQKVAEHVIIPFTIIDYSDQHLRNRGDTYQQLLTEDACRSIDIAIAPLMRFTVIRFSQDEYKIIWTRHHVLMDGNSVSQVLDNVFSVYLAKIQNKTYSLRSTPTIAEMQAQVKALSRPVTNNACLASFKGHSEYAIRPASISESVTYDINCIYDVISKSEYLKLREFIKAHHLTVNTLLLAAWNVVLSYYSNCDDVAVGFVRAFPREVTKGFVGVNMKTLPLVVNIDPTSTTLTYLHQVRKQMLTAKSHLFMPIKPVQKGQTLSKNHVLFDTIVDYKPQDISAQLSRKFTELNLSISLNLKTPHAIVLEVVDQGDQLHFEMHYDVNRYGQHYVRNMLYTVIRVMMYFTTHPNEQLHHAPIISAKDRQKILYDWNQTNTQYSIEHCIHTLFECQVTKNPNAAAIFHKGTFITYQDLNCRANQLAHYFVSQKWDSETPVILFLKSKVSMIISILAILKSGCAFIAIDHNTPIMTLDSLLANSGAIPVVTDLNTMETANRRIYETIKRHNVLINLNELALKDMPSNNLNLALSSSQLAYIIHTSGSTGQPKGVLIEHRSVVNQALSYTHRLCVDNKSKLLQLASCNFDVSIAEWSMALAGGACLYFQEKTFFAPKLIIKFMQQYQISHVLMTGSMLTVLPKVFLPHLKYMVVGGENIVKGTLDFWLAQKKTVIYEYGVTEATICSTAKILKTTENLTVGKPIANVKIYVLDNYLRPLPINVPGEIYIGGVGVARDYVNQRTLSEGSFIKNPFTTQETPYDRLYKTGDIGCWLPNGELKWLGRKDDEVKINGQRVKLSHLERTLETFDNIKQASVVIKKTGLQPIIIAYLLTDADINKNKIYHTLKVKFSSSVIPHHIISVKQLPLTINGKVDKQQLAKSFDEKEIMHSILPSENKTERKVMTVIEKILGKLPCPVDQKYIHSNFDALGFNSLDLARFAIELDNKFDCEIDVTMLFRFTNVAQLSKHIDQCSMALNNVN